MNGLLVHCPRRPLGSSIPTTLVISVSRNDLSFASVAISFAAVILYDRYLGDHQLEYISMQWRGLFFCAAAKHNLFLAEDGSVLEIFDEDKSPKKKRAKKGDAAEANGNEDGGKKKVRRDEKWCIAAT